MDDVERVQEVKEGDSLISDGEEDTSKISAESDETEWTFLDHKAKNSAQNSPKITITSHLLPPEADHDLSDGVSVISESDCCGGGNTPCESDSSAAGHNPNEAATGEKNDLESLPDVIEKNKRQKRDGYRPLTPPNTPEDRQVKAVCARTATEVVEKSEKRDMAIYEEFANGQGFHRFMGVYRRHIFFLMIIGGIIGGTIGHLYNASSHQSCDKDLEPLLNRINYLERENCALQKKIKVLHKEIVEGVWTGHERMDDKIVPEEVPVEKKEEEDFEKLIWQHISKTAKHDMFNDEEMQGDDPNIYENKEETSTPKTGQKEYNKSEGSGDKNRKFNGKFNARENFDKKKLEKNNDNYKKKEWKYGKDNSEEDDNSEHKNFKSNVKDYKKKYDSGEKFDKKKFEKRDWKNKDDNSEENSKEFKKNSGEKYDKFNKYQKDDKKFDNSKERGDYKKAKYNKKSGDDSDEDHSGENFKKEGDEWQYNRMKAREDLRLKHDNEKKNNWYLERGSEREHHRIKGEEHSRK